MRDVSRKAPPSLSAIAEDDAPPDALLDEQDEELPSEAPAARPLKSARPPGPVVGRASRPASRADYAPLLADLSLGTREGTPTWRVHDRTHLELVVDYPIGTKATAQDYECDVYFFIPDSLRMRRDTYEKEDIYEDFQSYVRFAVPPIAIEDITGAPIQSLERAIARRGAREAVLRELRLFGCMLRAASLERQQEVLATLARDADRGAAAAIQLYEHLARAVEALRASLVGLTAEDPDLQAAAAWTDEDASRVFEATAATLAIELEGAGLPADVVAVLRHGAVEEACYRRAHGLDGVGSGDATERDVEHLEFRRHLLKRFISSVLWMRVEVKEAGRLARHASLAVAASIAMSFAITASLFHGTPEPETLWKWGFAVAVAYAAKDRIKAVLQGMLSRVLERYVPDRRWTVREREHRRPVASVDERAGFVSLKDVPKAVRETRYATRNYSFEGEARPEQVLWHQKEISLERDAAEGLDPRFRALSEIFRVNLRRWLDHTDDPKRSIVFADPDDGQIYAASAKRVYNIAIVYRVRREGDLKAPWRRVRAVVTRKGVLRIDPIC